MLPRKLYELLPYFYIAVGIVCAVAIDSTIVLISSMLLIVAGVLVLLMRRNFRRPSMMVEESFEVMDGPMSANEQDGVMLRSDVDRRHRAVKAWPAYDDSGLVIYSDRRIGERRSSIIR